MQFMTLGDRIEDAMTPYQIGQEQIRQQQIRRQQTRAQMGASFTFPGGAKAETHTLAETVVVTAVAVGLPIVVSKLLSSKEPSERCARKSARKY